MVYQPRPEPIAFVAPDATNTPTLQRPEPNVIIGKIPAVNLPQVAHIGDAATFADLATATTAYNDLLHAMQTAGLMA